MEPQVDPHMIYKSSPLVRTHQGLLWCYSLSDSGRTQPAHTELRKLGGQEESLLDVRNLCSPPCMGLSSARFAKG